MVNRTVRTDNKIESFIYIMINDTRETRIYNLLFSSSDYLAWKKKLKYIPKCGSSGMGFFLSIFLHVPLVFTLQQQVTLTPFII